MESEEDIYCNLETLTVFKSGKTSSNMQEISDKNPEKAAIIRMTTQGSFYLCRELEYGDESGFVNFFRVSPEKYYRLWVMLHHS